jgi:hypothetical protein
MNSWVRIFFEDLVRVNVNTFEIVISHTLNSCTLQNIDEIFARHKSWNTSLAESFVPNTINHSIVLISNNALFEQAFTILSAQLDFEKQRIFRGTLNTGFERALAVKKAKDKKIKLDKSNLLIDGDRILKGNTVEEVKLLMNHFQFHSGSDIFREISIINKIPKMRLVYDVLGVNNLQGMYLMFKDNRGQLISDIDDKIHDKILHGHASAMVQYMFGFLNLQDMGEAKHKWLLDFDNFTLKKNKVQKISKPGTDIATNISSSTDNSHNLPLVIDTSKILPKGLMIDPDFNDKEES